MVIETVIDTDNIKNTLDEMTEGKALFADGFDEALIGIGRRCGSDPVAIYSTDKVLSILMRDGMTHEEALEYFEFNIIGAWVGEYTPVFLEI